MSQIIADYLKLKRKEKTRENILCTLKRFLNRKYGTAYKTLEELEPLAKQFLEEYTFQDILDYLVWLRDESYYQPTTISSYLSYVITFVEFHGIIVSKAERAKIHAAIPRPIPVTQDKPLTRDFLASMCTHADILLTSIILIASSSGMRINEILRLEIDDIEFGYPNKIHIPRERMKQGRPHTYRFSAEAAESLREWFEVREMYRKRVLKSRKYGKRVFPITTATVYSRWNSMLEKIGFDVRDKNTNRHLYTTHGCRRWFSSTASRYIQHEIVEALIGHDTGLSSAYRRYLEEDLDKEYLKIERYLCVTNHEDFLDPPEIESEFDALKDLIEVTKQLIVSIQVLREMIVELGIYQNERIDRLMFLKREGK